MERTAALDRKAKKDGAVFHVAVFGQKEDVIEMDFDSIGWAVTTTKSERDEGADSFKVVLIPELMRKLQRWNPLILSSPYLRTGSSTMEGFKTGKALTSLNTPIRACVGTSRPKLLYRVVHEKHPGNGLRSRGYGIVKTDQISFMLHFHWHLNWKSRNASPFMSTTTDRAKANRIARWYEREGFKNIEILVIKVDESKWLSESTIWHVKQTAASLGLSNELRPWGCDNEYLIENYIPESCVTRIQWKGWKADFKSGTIKMNQSKKRKRSPFESDGMRNETMLSNGQSRRIPGFRLW